MNTRLRLPFQQKETKVTKREDQDLQTKEEDGKPEPEFTGVRRLRRALRVSVVDPLDDRHRDVNHRDVEKPETWANSRRGTGAMAFGLRLRREHEPDVVVPSPGFSRSAGRADLARRAGGLKPGLQTKVRFIESRSGFWHRRSTLWPNPILAAGLFLAAAGAAVAQPVITQQPQAQTNVVGTTATFMVVATGTEPLGYQWQKNQSDLADRTNATLGLPNVQSSDAGDYRVVVTDAGGTTASDPARLTVLVPPRITPTASLQHSVVFVGQNATFSVTVSGTAPRSYQWRRDGADLLGKTNRSLTIAAAQPVDEGTYTVVVTNLAGTAVSDPARLYVVPPVSEFIRGDFTNNLAQRLPYFYLMPTNYNADHSYPLICLFHGSGQDESNFLSSAALTPYKLVFSSYRQQAEDPAIVVYPTRRAGGADWSDQYIQLTSGLLDHLISRFNIDTNRVYIGGGSQGVHAAWDLLGLRPGFFAAGVVGAGLQGNTSASLIQGVPLWVSCAQDDEAGLLSDTQALVRALRAAGKNVIYTEYNSGGHAGGIVMLWYTPAFRDWFFAQRRGVAPTNEPLLAIASPTPSPVYTTGAATVSLAGSAAALGQTVTKVAWENTANAAKGSASGTDTWRVTGIPLAANKTNLIIVTATTTSWAPAYGGNTTFNGMLTVVQSALRATLVLQGVNAVLTWTGSGPPYTVQRVTGLAAGNWVDVLTNAVPPVSLPLDGTAAFYRIVGQ